MPTSKPRLVWVDGLPYFETVTTEDPDTELTLKQARALIKRLEAEDQGRAFAWNGARIKRLRAHAARLHRNEQDRKRRAAKR